MDNELKHYGILGMKWGRRRYQYKDGSLTPAGKKRYGSSQQNNKQPSTQKEQTKEQPKKKNVKSMTYDELKKEVDRLQLEKRYKDLTQEEVSVGKQITKKMLDSVIVPTVTSVAREEFEKQLRNTLKKKKK